MDFAQLANFGEFIGGVAVLVTLLYLTTQIRQNTNQRKGEAIIAINDSEFERDKEVRGDLTLFQAALRQGVRQGSVNVRILVRERCSQCLYHCASTLLAVGWSVGAIEIHPLLCVQ